MTSVISSKMSFSLFLDSSHFLTIGLLDQNFRWIEYEHREEKKSASVVHALIWEMLQKNNLEIGDLSNFIYCAGPGSYTGMRVGDGIGRLFDWQKIKVKSFYHYQIPFLCDVKKGTWVANAYKGEVFLYEWDNEKSHESLIDQDKFEFDQAKIFSHDNTFTSNDRNTSVMIKNNSEKIFSFLIEKGELLPLNYFRVAEKEFVLK